MRNRRNTYFLVFFRELHTVKTKLVLALAAVLAFATSSYADFTPTVYNGSVDFPTNLSPTGDYFLAPGIGNGGGFFLAGGPFIDSTINDGTEDIGGDLLGGSVLSSDLLVDNGGGNFDLILTIESTSGDLAPAGLTDGGGAPPVSYTHLTLPTILLV